MVNIYGEVSAGFERVRDEFVKNFTRRDETGAAVCIYVDGECVVDLWGGERDIGETWEANTVVPVFSTTKGMSAFTFALAHSRGWLDYDEKIATYWAEFAQGGKEDFTVRDLLDHKLGLVAPPRKLTLEEFQDLDTRADILAQATPAWQPRQHWGYHASSLYLFGSEILRQVDPKHRPLAQIFAEEIAQPLDADFYITLPSDFPDSRRALLQDDLRWRRWLGIIASWHFYSNLVKPESLVHKAFVPVELEGNITSFAKMFNQRWILEIENGSSSGTASARGIAKIYNEFVTGGHNLDIAQATLDELAAPADIPSGGEEEIVLNILMHFHLGFLRRSRKIAFGNNGSGYGHLGLGGSGGFLVPEQRLAFGYTMRRMMSGLGYYRLEALLDATTACMKDHKWG